MEGVIAFLHIWHMYRANNQYDLQMNSTCIQERSGQTMFGRISNNIPENDVGVL